MNSMKMKSFYVTLLLLVSANANKNVPMDENTATLQFVQMIDAQCQKIPIDKQSINQLLKYCNIKENLNNVTACDLACEAYGINTTIIAKIMLNCDGDIDYLIRRINNLLGSELFILQNDNISINIYGYNNVTMKTNEYMVIRYTSYNKIASYMLKNLCVVKNSTNYSVKKERIAKIQIPAEEISLAILPILNCYHKYLRNNVAREGIDYEDEVYHFDDDFVEFEKKQEELEKQSQNEVVTGTSSPQKFNINEYMERKEKTTTTFEEIITTKPVEVTTAPATPQPPQPRLIEQFIDSDLPIVKLKEEQEQNKKKEEEEARTEEEAMKNREKPPKNVPKGLYDMDELDYTGINNVARARLENESVARKLEYKDNSDDDQINTRDMGSDYSDEEEDKERKEKKNQKEEKEKKEYTGEREQKFESTNNDNSTMNDSSDEVQSRDFTPDYTSVEETDSSRNQNNKNKNKGILGFILSPFKTGLTGLLKFARTAIIKVLDGAQSMAVASIAKPDNWFDRLLNYPKNFAILRLIDSINNAKKWINSVLDPVVNEVSGKNPNSRGVNPLTFISNPIRKSLLNFVTSLGRSIYEIINKIPIIGALLSPGVTPTIQFFEGLINRMFPH